MSDYIVDPTDPERAIHAPSGEMALKVYFAPIGTAPDSDAWRFAGFAGPFAQRRKPERKANHDA